MCGPAVTGTPEATQDFVKKEIVRWSDVVKRAGLEGTMLGPSIFSGRVAGGCNAPNRVMLTQDARRGDCFQIAVFGINGPISASPRNYIWMRTATLDFYAPERAAFTEEAPLEVDGDVPVAGPLERIAGGFEFTEGPVWTRDGARQLRLARALRCGQVFVNNYGAGGGVELPFGGVRSSGHGREKGFEALYGFTVLKTIAIRHG